MTCGDCIYGELCMNTTDTTWFNKTEYRFLDDVEKFCEDFKNKADFVKVVRCKDCKHCEDYDEHDEYGWYHCAMHEMPVKLDWFCNFGERSD